MPTRTKKLPVGSAATGEGSASVIRMPPPSALQALQSVPTSSPVVGRLSGAFRIPMSSPTTCSSMASCGTMRGVVSPPRMSHADTMLVTRRRTTGASSSSSSESVMT